MASAKEPEEALRANHIRLIATAARRLLIYPYPALNFLFHSVFRASGDDGHTSQDLL
jgi:hypothetical protein